MAWSLNDELARITAMGAAHDAEMKRKEEARRQKATIWVAIATHDGAVYFAASGKDATQASANLLAEMKKALQERHFHCPDPFTIEV